MRAIVPLTPPWCRCRVRASVLGHFSPLHCRSGGIGRRAWFRSMSGQPGGGSSPLFGTIFKGWIRGRVRPFSSALHQRQIAPIPAKKNGHPRGERRPVKRYLRARGERHVLGLPRQAIGLHRQSRQRPMRPDFERLILFVPNRRIRQSHSSGPDRGAPGHQRGDGGVEEQLQKMKHQTGHHGRTYGRADHREQSERYRQGLL